MVYEAVTTLDGAEVLRRAKSFFAERVPLNAAYPEKEGPGYLVLRGQGGEEIALAVLPAAGGTRVRARRCCSISRGPLPLDPCRRPEHVA